MGLFNSAINKIEHSVHKGSSIYPIMAGISVGTTVGASTYFGSDQNKLLKSGISALGSGALAGFGLRYGINKRLDSLVDMNVNLIATSKNYTGNLGDDFFNKKISKEDFSKITKEARYHNISDSNNFFSDAVVSKSIDPMINSTQENKVYAQNGEELDRLYLLNFTGKTKRRDYLSMKEKNNNITKFQLRNSLTDVISWNSGVVVDSKDLLLKMTPTI